MNRINNFLSIFFLTFLIIGCSASTPQPTPTSIPPTPIPPTLTPIPPKPTSTITPTKNPINFDLSGNWFFLTGNNSKPEPAILTQTGDKLSGEIFVKGGDTVSILGSIDPLTLEINGTWSSKEGKKGVFVMHLRDDPDQLSGSYDNALPLCAARDSSSLPKICDWIK